MEAISKSVEKFTDEDGEISEIKEQPLPEDLPEEFIILKTHNCKLIKQFA